MLSVVTCRLSRVRHIVSGSARASAEETNDGTGTLLQPTAQCLQVAINEVSKKLQNMTMEEHADVCKS